MDKEKFIKAIKLAIGIVVIVYTTLAGMGLLPASLDFLNLYG